MLNLLEPEAGIEPATYALRVRCSTTEPLGRDSSRYRLTFGHGYVHKPFVDNQARMSSVMLC